MQEKEMQLGEMQYIISYPKGFDSSKRYPVILLLHGAGSRGTDLDVLRTNPYFVITTQHENFPFITIAPQCSKNTWFDMFEQLQALVRQVANESYVDTKRIYVMGASMGGYATWQLAMSMPEYFAAICPICGGGMYWNAGRLLNVPVWAFHGKLDNVVFVEESRKMVDAVKRSGGNAKLTIYPDNGHDAWSDTYQNFEVFEWLLSCENENASELTDGYRGSSVFG